MQPEFHLEPSARKRRAVALERKGIDRAKQSPPACLFADRDQRTRPPIASVQRFDWWTLMTFLRTVVAGLVQTGSFSSQAGRLPILRMDSRSKRLTNVLADR